MYSVMWIIYSATHLRFMYRQVASSLQNFTMLLLRCNMSVPCTALLSHLRLPPATFYDVVQIDTQHNVYFVCTVCRLADFPKD